ncbi:hypothetical protein OG225_33680 [Nocardia sp. NBC_01377]|uniref:hypothetical protein n=1 Tax=Nocardia sp. NBC_01377 TaxID=2903595 RepID=UPI003249A9B3
MSRESADARQDELFRLIWDAMVEAAPPDWLRLDLMYMSVGDATELTLWGAWHEPELRSLDVPEPVELALQELRSTMYKPGEGTWFAARFYLTAPRQEFVIFDFDNDPAFENPIDPSEWRRDIALYPRDPQFVQKWLRELLT